MSELKKVLVDADSFVSNIFHDDSWQEIELEEGQILEDREMEFTEENGWREVKSLDDIKHEKISELDLACRNTILGQFKASIDDVEYKFSYDMEAQSRFIGMGVLFLANKISEIEWTAYKNGERVRIILNSNTFDIVSLAALQHQNANIVKYNELLQQVSEANTKEQVEAIVW